MKEEQIQAFMAELGVPLINLDSVDLKEEESTEKTIILRGTLQQQNQDIAVKRFQQLNNKEIVDFKREITFLAELGNSEFIIQILGYALIADGLAQIIFPWYSPGDLFTLIANDRIRSEDLIPLMKDIAEALAYLHSRHIVHMDIKLENIFMRGSKPVLGDLGHARRKGSTVEIFEGEKVGTGGTIGYIAPEVLRDRSNFDLAADIYSLGITYWVMLFGRERSEDIILQLIHQNAIPDASGSDSEVDITELFNAAVIDGARPSFTRKSPIRRFRLQSEILFDVISSCWQGDPKQRPTAIDLQSLLQDADELSQQISPPGVMGRYLLERFRRTGENPIESADKTILYYEQREQTYFGRCLAVKWFVATNININHEIAILRRLADPIHIVRLCGYYFGIFGQLKLRAALVFPRMHSDLSTVVAHGIDAHDLPRLIVDIARRVRYCHKNNVVHRRLQPQHFLIADARQPPYSPLLAGLGYAQTIDSDVSMPLTKTSMGEMGYQSPEQLTDPAIVSKASDIYSLTMVICFMLTQQSPFAGFPAEEVQQRVIDGERPALRSRIGEYEKIFKLLVPLLQQGWQPKPSDRPDISLLCKQLKHTLGIDRVVRSQATRSSNSTEESSCLLL